MKSIYILLTKSTTICSKIVYLATRSEFTHAAISLDSSFNELYTFGRKYSRLMLPAGFAIESVYNGILGSSDNMKCAIYELKISDKVYGNLVRILNYFELNRARYRYSIVGLPMCKFKKVYEREDYFFCSQFVYHALSESGAIAKNSEPSLVGPMDLSLLPEATEVFKGEIRSLRVNGLALSSMAT